MMIEIKVTNQEVNWQSFNLNEDAFQVYLEHLAIYYLDIQLIHTLKQLPTCAPLVGLRV